MHIYICIFALNQSFCLKQPAEENFIKDAFAVHDRLLSNAKLLKLVLGMDDACLV